MLPTFIIILSSSNLFLDAYNTLMFYRRALLWIVISIIEGKCTSSRIGLLASVQVLLEEVGELNKFWMTLKNVATAFRFGYQYALTI